MILEAGGWTLEAGGWTLETGDTSFTCTQKQVGRILNLLTSGGKVRFTYKYQCSAVHVVYVCIFCTQKNAGRAPVEGLVWSALMVPKGVQETWDKVCPLLWHASGRGGAIDRDAAQSSHACGVCGIFFSQRVNLNGHWGNLEMLLLLLVSGNIPGTSYIYTRYQLLLSILLHRVYGTVYFSRKHSVPTETTAVLVAHRRATMNIMPVRHGKNNGGTYCSTFWPTEELLTVCSQHISFLVISTRYLTVPYIPGIILVLYNQFWAGSELKPNRPSGHGKEKKN